MQLVLKVLARHGLFQLLAGGLPRGDEGWRRLGRRVKQAFYELGPTYIKLGQVLVTRQELFPDPFTSELATLLDEVPPMPFPYIAYVLEEELPDGLATFRAFDPEPIASASVAQVYRAELRDGRPCAVKVVRPLVDRLFQTDIGVIKALARRVQRFLPPPVAASLDLPGILEDYYSSALSELDMRLEARNTEEGRQMVQEFATLAVPEVYLATRRVLVLEYVDGWNIKDFPVDFLTFEERLEIMLDLAHLYIKTFLEGFYHADPHGGNLMIGRNKKAYIIDWGMVGRMDATHTEAVFRTLLHVRSGQAKDAAEAIMEVYEPTPFTDRGRLRDQLRALGIQYVNTEQGSLRNWGSFLIQSIRVAFQNHCRIPSGLALWAKGWSAAEGTARWLCPEISFHQVVESADIRIIESWIKRRFNYRTNASLLAETAELLATLPRRLKNVLESLAWNDLRFTLEARIASDQQRHLDRLVNRLSLSMLAVGLFVGGSFLATLESRIPSMGLAAELGVWGGLALGTYALYRILRHRI
ncbi:putative unusual protein kinase [Thermus oshimai JL-2]|uniref:Putative unusual protein kinase n=1 Tax=Thermus oshimai JL-2 TaxID=751945 RepID=K7QVI1_THEOS|nr:AarF/UbiB family protein [Thermus oshimai]AFV76561.1 putative unusual protein kinase [Thermus oshimai JL-2]